MNGLQGNSASVPEGIYSFTMYTDGVNEALATTFAIDAVIAKSDSILVLKEHLVRLLTAVDPQVRAADLRKNTTIH